MRTEIKMRVHVSDNDLTELIKSDLVFVTLHFPRELRLRASPHDLLPL